MMALSTPTVTVWFGSDINQSAFILNHPTKGLLNGATYTLGGEVGTDISADVFNVSIRRGRDRELDEFSAGVCTVELRNENHDYSPIHTGAAYAGFLTPGKRVQVRKYNQTLFEGVTESWSSSQDPDGTSVAVMTAYDGLGQLGRMEFAEWSPTPGETADERLESALNRAEVNFGVNRLFDTGVSTLQGGAVSAGTNVLNYCQQVALSDFGLFFASRDNLLKFYNRQHQAEEPVADFNDDPTQWHDGTTPTGPFDSYVGADTSERLINRVSVTIEGGSTQTADDVESQDAYGVRALSVDGLLLDSDAAALSFAEYLLALYKAPAHRLDSVTVNISAIEGKGLNPAPFARLDIGSFVEVSLTGVNDTGGIRANDYQIEGVEHTIPRDGPHMMRLATTQFERITFILNDVVNGVLGTSRLGY